MLELKKIKKQYQAGIVLEIPSLILEDGIYWIKGENGSGKTTLLKMISGITPFEGDIFFKGISLKEEPLTYRKAISWGEAQPVFPSFLTGKQLLVLYQDIRSAPLKEIDRLTEIFNMQEYINSATGTYSAGMNKKLSLALAFLGNPALVILDEPLITLDPPAFEQVCSLILEKNKNTGTFFLMSSHQETNAPLLAFAKQLIVNDKTITSI